MSRGYTLGKPGAGHEIQEPSPGCAARSTIRSGCPRSTAGGRLALSVAGCDLCEGAPDRTHRLGRGDCGCGRQTKAAAILGVAIGASEAETFWTEFLRSLARRGLRGVKPAGDLRRPQGPEGRRARLGATWQRCRVHGPCRKQGRRVARLRRHRLRPGGRRQREGPVAPGRRPAQAQGAQAGRSHGRVPSTTSSPT